MKYMIKKTTYFTSLERFVFLKLASETERTEKVIMLGTNTLLTIAIGLEPHSASGLFWRREIYRLMSQVGTHSMQ